MIFKSSSGIRAEYSPYAPNSRPASSNKSSDDLAMLTAGRGFHQNANQTTGIEPQIHASGDYHDRLS
ncbi:MAG: hypothetical protein ACYC9L_00815 [Sulfuricaulis sp.]